ncbi:MAG: trehalose-phosphatase [Syntrophobacteria bacterium]
MNRAAVTLAKSRYDAVIFDLDGVVTKTATVHAAAWKELFDQYLEERGSRENKDWEPFDVEDDYRRYVDGKPRYEGVESFLKSRGIELPRGSPDDGPDRETVCGLGNRKNELFHERLKKQGVELYASTIDLIHQLRSKTFKTAVVSSSKNCSAILDAAGKTDLFDVKVDGVDAEQLEFKGKPAPDIFLEAARRLGVDPEHAVVVEDAMAGVEAGYRGNFGCVIGVDRSGEAAALKDSGADLVVSDLQQVTIKEASAPQTSMDALCSALECRDEIEQSVQGRRLAVFLDYDGTLTPIVESPQKAFLSQDMRRTVRNLANGCTVAVISGRDLDDVRERVGIENIFYAGSHGFDIAGPEGWEVEAQQGLDFLPVLDRAEQRLRHGIDTIAGALVERKKFSVAVHYRKVQAAQIQAVEQVVDQVNAEFPQLRKSYGKKVYELQPEIGWNKGKALLWLLEELELDRPDVLPLYIGDDITDEDAFEVLRDRGIGIVVGEESRSTAARYTLADPEDVREFLQALSSLLEEPGNT